MRLIPREIDKLLLHQGNDTDWVTMTECLITNSCLLIVGVLAQKRLARGVKLNHTEATALIASQLLELMRDGVYSVAQLMDMGKQMLGRRHVQPDAQDTVQEVQIEGTFPDGTYLVTVHDPICTDYGNLELALYGSFLPIPSQDKFPPLVAEVIAEHDSIDTPMTITNTPIPTASTKPAKRYPPGVILPYGHRRHQRSGGGVDVIELCPGRKRLSLTVSNQGDRPIQVM